jgi:hypothetical protein
MPSKHEYITSFGEIRPKRVFSLFLCAACLPGSLIMHVPISELDAQWHFSMSLNSPRFLQFLPTVMLVAYDNSCLIIIRQNFFPDSLSSRISWNYRTTTFADIFPQQQTSRIRSKRPSKVIWIWAYILLKRQESMFEMCFHENKRE